MPHRHALVGLAFAAVVVVLGMAVVRPSEATQPHPVVLQMAANGLAIPAATPDMTGKAGPASAYPDPRLTPGVVAPVTKEQVCQPGYAKGARDVPESVKREVSGRYGIPYQPMLAETDHLISLEIGGTHDVTNLWPESYAGQWGARTKDKLENALHAKVCSGALTLAEAQDAIRTDWVAAYLKYVGGK